jgi:signal transduction histidine kinase
MMAEASKMKRQRAATFPEKVFVLIIAAVCLGLALNAAYGYRTLLRLRAESLRGRAGDIIGDLDRSMRGPGLRGPGMPGAGARGPGVRSDPSAWQNAFEDAFSDYRESVAFLALVDESDGVLASVGGKFSKAFTARAGFTSVDGTELYVLDQQIGPGRPDRMSKASFFPPRRLRVGLYTSSADFILRQAYLQLVVSGIAIAALILLACYLLRTLHRFLELKAREESARHLTALGAMAATLAHEIRNPLGAMKGLTQLAQEDLPKEHDAQQFMKTVVSEAERLEQLVTDLLSFAGPKEPRLSTFDFMPLLSEVKAQLETRPESAGRAIDVVSESESVPVHSDENGLRQILLNILLNALEATPEGRSLAVKVGLDKGRGVLRVDVDDGGPGLGRRDPEELFEPFVTTKTKGTGLGLPVSRQIAAALGGTLTLSNRAEGGARCTLRIPVAGDQP